VAAEAVTRSNVVVLKSLGKNFGLHGIRFGYLVANPGLAGMIARALPKWNLNALAEEVVFMIEDHWPAYERSLELLIRDRTHMIEQLGRVDGLTIFPSTANFVLVKVPTGWDGRALRDDLINHHDVFVRECGNKIGMTSDYLRVVVRPAADVERLIHGLRDHSRRRQMAHAA
jgi:histidinol-phosphate/aromatic aminotransferase/cobyric acid decarboxylase-like protein